MEDGTKIHFMYRMGHSWGNWGYLGATWGLLGVIVGPLGAILGLVGGPFRAIRLPYWAYLGLLLGCQKSTPLSRISVLQILREGFCGTRFAHGVLKGYSGPLLELSGAFSSWGHLGTILSYVEPILGLSWGYLNLSWHHLGAMLGLSGVPWGHGGLTPK